LGETKEARPSKAVPAVGIEDPIRQLQENMVEIEGGQFDMGSSEEEAEQPIHKVELEGFEMSAMPVTQAQYHAIMKTNPSHFKGEDLPVESVSWDDAVKFCERLSEKTGRQYTLPTEAQWEYACRADSTGKYCFGDDESQLGEYAWYDANAKSSTHPVGKKKPNNWGLYDVHGNVWEWVRDDWHGSYEGAPNDGRAWTDSPERGSGRVLRGGAWYDDARFCRSAYRYWDDPRGRDGFFGFRVVSLSSGLGPSE